MKRFTYVLCQEYHNLYQALEEHLYEMMEELGLCRLPVPMEVRKFSKVVSVQNFLVRLTLCNESIYCIDFAKRVQHRFWKAPQINTEISHYRCRLENRVFGSW